MLPVPSVGVRPLVNPHWSSRVESCLNLQSVGKREPKAHVHGSLDTESTPSGGGIVVTIVPVNMKENTVISRACAHFKN